jgi:hypothetical protein
MYFIFQKERVMNRRFLAVAAFGLLGGAQFIYGQSGSFSAQALQGQGGSRPMSAREMADRMNAADIKEEYLRRKAVESKKADNEFAAAVNNATPAQKKKIEGLDATYDPKIAVLKDQLEKLEAAKKAAILKVLAIK